MRRSWKVVLLVIVIGGVAGLAIAGPPKGKQSFVIDGPVTTTTTVETTVTSAPIEPGPSIATIEAATTSTESPTPLRPTTTVATATTLPDSTVATTAAPTTSTSAATTTTANTPGGVDKATMRLVIANADGRYRLASITAERLRAAGYLAINLGDASAPRDLTAIYYRPGFLESAAAVAGDLGVADVPLLAMPDAPTTPLTNSDDAGDVIVLLGADAPR